MSEQNTTVTPSEYGAQFDEDVAVIAQYETMRATNPVVASRFAIANQVFDRMSRSKAAVAAKASELGVPLPDQPNPNESPARRMWKADRGPLNQRTAEEQHAIAAQALSWARR